MKLVPRAQILPAPAVAAVVAGITSAADEIIRIRKFRADRLAGFARTVYPPRGRPRSEDFWRGRDGLYEPVAVWRLRAAYKEAGIEWP